MKRLAAILVILVFGILPAASESLSTQPVRGAELDAMAREILEWIILNTEEYLPSGSPRIVFVDNFQAAIVENELKSSGRVDADYEFHGSYKPNTKTVYLLDRWSGNTPIDWADLVHELVHYVQYETSKRFECREDRELEANVLTVNFINDRFKRPWPHIADDLRADRKKQATCTPP